jgi:hypothetical protein
LRCARPGWEATLPLPDIIAAVTARVAAVAGLVNVYSYAREAKEQKEFQQLFQDPANNKLHTWMVTREGTETRDDGVGCYRRIHKLAIMGYYSVDDLANSESTFQGLIEDVCAAFDPLALRQYPNAEGVPQYDWSQPVQVDGPTVLMYGRYLCHAVKLVHRVEELLYEQPE